MPYLNLTPVQEDYTEPGMPLAVLGPRAAGSRTNRNVNPESITVLLSRVSDGDRDAFDNLFPLVYQELHRIAEGYLRREVRNHTLQPTALINEAYLRLAEYGGTDYQNRSHFFAISARVMRQILVDHARARNTAKRSAIKVPFHPGMEVASEQNKMVIALDDALKTLAAEDGSKARLVELRFFGGMTAEEIAECEAMPVHVVRRQLRIAQAWLRREMGAQSPD